MNARERGMTRKAMWLYNISEMQTLSQVYGRYSYRKYNAYEECIFEMRRLEGWRFRIITHNTSTFTCGFTYIDTKTGVLMFRFITKWNRYDIEWSDNTVENIH